MGTQVTHMIDSNNTFVAKDKDGNEVSMDEYLKFASLSPWVPCPDPVATRALDIARVGPDDVSSWYSNHMLMHACINFSFFTDIIHI